MRRWCDVLGEGCGVSGSELRARSEHEVVTGTANSRPNRPGRRHDACRRARSGRRATTTRSPRAGGLARRLDWTDRRPIGSGRLDEDLSPSAGGAGERRPWMAVAAAVVLSSARRSSPSTSAARPAALALPGDVSASKTPSWRTHHRRARDAARSGRPTRRAPFDEPRRSWVGTATRLRRACGRDRRDRATLVGGRSRGSTSTLRHARPARLPRRGRAEARGRTPRARAAARPGGWHRRACRRQAAHRRTSRPFRLALRR